VSTERVPLWRDLRGKTTYRILSALVLDELAQRSGLTAAEMLRRLRAMLGRSLSRQTFAAWRRGDQPIPAEVIVAMAAIARVTLTDASVRVAISVVGDPEADPRFAAALRRYYRPARIEFGP
jgi:transcriptional regulator with XRE-family HTH domain